MIALSTETKSTNITEGTILSTSNSIHGYKDASTKARDIDNLRVVIDENVKSKEDVLALGIQNGDIIAYNPKFEVTESGNIK